MLQLGRFPTSKSMAGRGLSARFSPSSTSLSVPAAAIHPSRHSYSSPMKLLRSAAKIQFSTSPSSSNNRDLNRKDFAYCVDLVQNRDRESYLCGLLMPYKSRRAYFAIRALNVELASIKDGSISRKVGGAQFADEAGANLALKVRMQWWREALGRIFEDVEPQTEGFESGNDGTPSQGDDTTDAFFASMASSYYKNPVVRVLDYAVHEKQLTRRFLERLLEARESDLDIRQPESTKDMINYADNTFSSLLYLSLETVDVRDEASDIVAQHAGIGMGLVTALRGARIRLSRGEFSVPKDLIPPQFPYHKLYNLNEELGVDLTEEENQMLRDAVEEICGLAFSHLSRAQELQKDVPRHARPCFLPVIPAMHYLTKLEKANYDIFDDRLLEQDHLKILFLLSRTWLTGVF